MEVFNIEPFKFELFLLSLIEAWDICKMKDESFVLKVCLADLLIFVRQKIYKKDTIYMMCIRGSVAKYIMLFQKG